MMGVGNPDCLSKNIPSLGRVNFNLKICPKMLRSPKQNHYNTIPFGQRVPGRWSRPGSGRRPSGRRPPCTPRCGPSHTIAFWRASSLPCLLCLRFGRWPYPLQTIAQFQETHTPDALTTTPKPQTKIFSKITKKKAESAQMKLGLNKKMRDTTKTPSAF